MSDFETEATEGKRTRRPSEPKPMFIVYNVNPDGQTITVHDLTRDAGAVLVAIDDDNSKKYTKVMM